MSYIDINKIMAKAEELIIAHDLTFVDDVVAMLPISRQAFYKNIPVGSENMDKIKELLDNNKISLKMVIRNKLLRSNKAAELIALYKLMANTDEIKALSMVYTEQKLTVKDEVEEMTESELEEEIRRLENKRSSYYEDLD